MLCRDLRRKNRHKRCRLNLCCVLCMCVLNTGLILVGVRRTRTKTRTKARTKTRTKSLPRGRGLSTINTVYGLFSFVQIELRVPWWSFLAHSQTFSSIITNRMIRVVKHSSPNGSAVRMRRGRCWRRRHPTGTKWKRRGRQIKGIKGTIVLCCQCCVWACKNPLN